MSNFARSSEREQDVINMAFVRSISTNKVRHRSGRERPVIVFEFGNEDRVHWWYVRNSDRDADYLWLLETFAHWRSA